MTETTDLASEMRLHAPECGCCQVGADEIDRLRAGFLNLKPTREMLAAIAGYATGMLMRRKKK